MRLVRCAQFALGLAISGGLAVALSGSAFAAASGTGTASQGNLDVQTTGIEQVDTNTTILVDETNEIAATGGVVADNVTGSNDTLQLASGGSNSDGRTAQFVGANGDPKNLSGEQTKPSNSEAVAKQVGAGGTSLGGNFPAITGEIGSASPSLVVQGISYLGNASVMRGSFAATLPIQPTITGRTALGGDLAAHAPSATMPAGEPTPTKPTGLLTRLTAGLAGSIVPTFFGVIAGPVDMSLIWLNVVALVVLLLAGLMANYGLWLRRGGFAHAARSDVPSSLHITLATPLLMSYAWVYELPRSSFLNGVRNEFQNVPMLSERRNTR